MAILAGIGRALTSVGSDLQRNRLEREERERRLSDLKEQRAYDTSIRDQQARIRADETRENRDWTIRNQAGQRLFATGEAIRAQKDREEAAKLANDQRIAAAALAQTNAVNARQQAVTDAAGVVSARQEYDEGQFQEGVNAMTRVGRAGTPQGFPYEDPDALHPPPTAEDRAIMGRENLSFPTQSAGRAAAVRRSVAAAGEVVNDEGRVTDLRFDPHEQERLSQLILSGVNPFPDGWPGQYVEEPPFESELIKTPGLGGWAKRVLPFGDPGWSMTTDPTPTPQGRPRQGSDADFDRLRQLGYTEEQIEEIRRNQR